MAPSPASPSRSDAEVAMGERRWSARNPHFYHGLPRLLVLRHQVRFLRQDVWHLRRRRHPYLLAVSNRLGGTRRRRDQCATGAPGGRERTCHVTRPFVHRRFLTQLSPIGIFLEANAWPCW